MRSDFERGSPTPYEINHTEWTDERLSERLNRLNAIDQPWQGSQERIDQIRREKELIAFEIGERYREAKQLRIEDAYEAVQRIYDERSTQNV